MSKLNKNEANYLGNATVRKGLNVVKVNRLQQAYDKANRSKYETSLDLAMGVAQAIAYFNTAKAKEERKAQHIEWTTEDLANKGFDKYMSKGWMYKLTNAIKCGEDVRTFYRSAVTTLEEGNHSPKLSINELLRFNTKFVKTTENLIEAMDSYIADWISTKEDAFVGKTETAETEVETETEEDEDVQIEMLSDIFGMNFKNEDGDNVHVRVDASGRMMTTNSVEQIKEAIAFLTSKLK